METIYTVSIRRPSAAVIAALAVIAATIDSDPQDASGPVDVTVNDLATLADAGCIVTCPTCEGEGEIGYMTDVDEANVYKCPTCAGYGECTADAVADAPSADDAIYAIRYS